MQHDSNYVRDVENYFLSLAGEGIMLSSMDYNLIMEWRDKEIPKEVVFKGINKAFQDFKAKEGQGPKSAKNLKRCVRYIDKSIKEYSPIIGRDTVSSESVEMTGELNIVIDRLNKYINLENDLILKSYYNNVKDKISSIIKSSDEEGIALISQIEQESLNELFLNLPDAEKKSITKEAKRMLGNRVRHMTREAVEESIVSFRNELLVAEYNIKNLLSNEDTDG